MKKFHENLNQRALAIDKAAKKRKRNFRIIVTICVLLWLASDVFLIVFAAGWGKECYQRGVQDGYKLRKFETELKGQQRLDSIIQNAIKPKPYKSL